MFPGVSSTYLRGGKPSIQVVSNQVTLIEIRLTIKIRLRVMAAPVIPDAASEILRDQKHIDVVKIWVVLRDQSLFKSEEGKGGGRRVEEKKRALNYFLVEHGDLERPKGKLEEVLCNKNKKLSISIFW